MIRFIERTVRELAPGDHFTLAEGGPQCECAYNLWQLGTLAIVDPSAANGSRTLTVTDPEQAVWVEVEIVRLNVTLRLEVDVAAWAREYSLEPGAAKVTADVRSYFDPNALIPEHLRGIVGVKGTETALDPIGGGR